MNPCLILFPFSFYVFHVFSCLCFYSSYCFIASCICSLLVLNEVYLNLNLSLKRKCRVKSTGGSRWGEEGLRGGALYLEIISIGGCVCHSVVKSETHTYLPTILISAKFLLRCLSWFSLLLLDQIWFFVNSCILSPSWAMGDTIIAGRSIAWLAFLMLWE